MDAFKNNVWVEVLTPFDNVSTTIVLKSGDGVKLPDPSTEGEYNLGCINFTDYKIAADDPTFEFIRVTGLVGDTITGTRAQEGTNATVKNVSGKVYKMYLAVTAKTLDEIDSRLMSVADKSKLDGIESGATDDQTDVEIKTAYENNANTNAFEDADELKLDSVESNADVTNSTNVDAAGAVMESDYNAQTVIAAIVNNTPIPLTIPEQTLFGRITGGNVTSLTPTQIRTLLNIENGATADQTASEVPIVDSGALFTAIDVEGALAENRTAVNLNTIHKSSNGSDHGYINQSVVSGSSPTFDGANIDNVDADEQYLLRNAWWGTFQEAFDAVVTSDGAIITMSLQSSDAGDLIMQFSDALTTLDCTPAQTIALTAGTDTNPQENYVYILQSAKVLAVSTTGWPSAEHIKVGYFYVQSALHVQTEGVLINQNWNDPLSNGNNTGHVTHVAQWIRAQGANWFSGCDGGGTSGYITSYAGGATIQVNAGVIMQMHKHTYAAKDTSVSDDIHCINYPSDAFKEVSDLNELLLDSTGGSLTGKYFNIILIGVANKSGEYAPLLVTLPAGSYNTSANAISDTSDYDDYSIPREFNKDSSTGFLIARITLRNQTDTTFTVVNTQDLRGLSAATAGASLGAETLVNFADNQFTVYDNIDPTKIINFEANVITTGNTRTITMADWDIDLADMISGANATDLTDAGDTILHYHALDRARANHSGTQVAATISDFDTEVGNQVDVAANTSHRGSTANPHSVTKAQVGLTNVEDIKVNLIATTDPGVTDDGTAGYGVLSRWANVTLDKEFVCLDSATGAAVWIDTTASGGSAHDLGGVLHNADTLANLNSKVSDATLIDTADSRLSDSRPPTAHASSHVTGGGDTIADVIAAGNSGLMGGSDKTKINGIEALADITDAINIASSVNGVAGKTTPVDADLLSLVDSADASSLKKLTWVNAKATLKTYFDTLYNLYSHPNHTGDVTSTGDGAQILASVAISGQTLVTAVGTDYILIGDTSDTSNLKKALISDISGNAVNAELPLTADGAKRPVTDPAFYNEASGATVYPGWSYLGFDDTEVESAFWWINTPELPSTLDVDIYWYTTAITGNVLWQVGLITFGDGDAWQSVTPTVTSLSVDAASGTTLYLVKTTVTGYNPVSVTNANEMGLLQLKRLGSDGTDTLVGDAKVLFIIPRWVKTV